MAFFFVWVASRSFMHKIKMAEITTASARLQEQVPIFQLTAVSWLLKLVLVMITLPLLLAVWLAKWFVTFLHHCSAWIFYLLGSVLLATAILSFLMQQSQGVEALQMLIGGFVAFMVPQVVGSMVILLELAAVMLRQVWYI